MPKLKQLSGKEVVKIFELYGFKIKSITFGLATSEKDKELIMKNITHCAFYQIVNEDKIHKPFSLIQRKIK